ncbi:gamma-crystallin M3-like [Xyrichtys novacula]|uniref:Gamma-crystallin M3-like n=1 Tax=Xyrichtys novacula TaxID=13765 RepID=A0AAV1GZ93_XYRNO|nr:gamma-crystallin M3-like [Xyrichtys novacula]
MATTDVNVGKLGKIILYEDKNFQGRSYECMSDCADMSPYLSNCQSCKVAHGCFMVYDRPNFTGNQVFMKKGEYADYMSMMGMTSGIKSCRIIPVQQMGVYKIRLFEKENLKGQMHELMNDCDNIEDRLHMSECKSCNVLDGHWLLYEQPLFKGKMAYLMPGEYKSLREMGNLSKIMSLRCIMDMWLDAVFHK